MSWTRSRPYKKPGERASPPSWEVDRRSTERVLRAMPPHARYSRRHDGSEGSLEFTPSARDAGGELLFQIRERPSHVLDLPLAPRPTRDEAQQVGNQWISRLENNEDAVDLPAAQRHVERRGSSSFRGAFLPIRQLIREVHRWHFPH